MRKPYLYAGDRVVVKFHDGSVMGYFLSYYNADYAVCTTDDQADDAPLLTERRRISKAPAASAPPVANIQIYEATTPPHTNDNQGGANG